jgi:hypothetical protein
MRKQAPVTDRLLSVKITLKDVKPPVWRRLIIPTSATFDDLHYYIQIAMGWENSHLHMFKVGSTKLSDPEQSIGGNSMLDSTKITIEQALAGQTDASAIEYLYDFGDDWLHIVTVEKEVERDPNQYYPQCIGGKNAAPPEDSGGPYGFEGLLEIIADPKHEQYADIKQWLGDYDPKHFNTSEVNEELINYGEFKKNGR